MLNSFLKIFLSSVILLSCTKTDITGNKPNSQTGIIYFGNGNASTLYAYNLEESKFQWQVDQVYAWNISIPVFENNVIYTGNVYGLSAVNATSGSIIWKRDFGSSGYRQSVGFSPANNVVISDSMIYLIGYKGLSDHSWLHAMNKFSGAIVWEKDLSAGLRSPKWTYTTPAVAGDKIFAVAKDNNLTDRIYCLNKKTGTLASEIILEKRSYMKKFTLVKDNVAYYPSR